MIPEEIIPSVIGDVRKNMGLDEDDPSKDGKIAKMSRSQIFERYMTWNGRRAMIPLFGKVEGEGGVGPEEFCKKMEVPIKPCPQARWNRKKQIWVIP